MVPLEEVERSGRFFLVEKFALSVVDAGGIVGHNDSTGA